MKVFFSWIFVAFFCLKFVSGQNIPAFVNKAKILKADQQTRGIIPSAMVDIDGDLIDDIVTLDKGFSYKVFLEIIITFLLLQKLLLFFHIIMTHLVWPLAILIVMVKMISLAAAVLDI
ncbi:MAG: hypothetical protein IPI53_14145 [Saprospiraceae bacterium]|nr:hypothetical protein [Saprospiraceae bacterium]